MPYTQQLANALEAYKPTILAPDGRPIASVAMILADSDLHGADLLLIKRAVNPGDPWSGHLAFPGGRMDPEDASRQRAAEREAHEEVGLNLQGTAQPIGRLSDMGSAGMPIIVSAFVYRLPARAELTLQASEVAGAHWVPFPNLLESGRQTEHHFVWDERPMTFPAIELFGAGEPVLWGLTYAFVTQALDLMGHALPRAW